MPAQLPTVFSLFLAIQLGSAAAWGENLVTKTLEAPPASADGYELCWADEFDEDGPPSPAKWGFEQGFRRNKEAQWYQSDNAFCERGLLVIEARRERVKPDPSVTLPALDWARHRTHADYTSASLNTRGKHEWLYGRFVMRAKIPAVEGAWPAFWTLGNGPWPACGEIDIMEYYDDSLLANVAWKRPGHGVQWKAVKKPIGEFGDNSWSDAFHEWRMDWDAQSIKLYVDDRLVNEMRCDEVQEANQGEGAESNPFHKPHYVLVNLAIGGRHGGDPARTAFPLRYEIDYVRVYQRSDATP